MLGGEEGEVSIAEVKREYAVLHCSDARASNASEFLGFDSMAWDRAMVRHLVARSVLLKVR
jgi:hypothetical protein